MLDLYFELPGADLRGMTKWKTLRVTPRHGPDRAIGPLGLFLGSDKEPKGAGAQGRQEMQLSRFSRFFSLSHLSHSVNCCCRLSESLFSFKDNCKQQTDCTAYF